MNLICQTTITQRLFLNFNWYLFILFEEEFHTKLHEKPPVCGTRLQKGNLHIHNNAALFLRMKAEETN